MCVECNDNDKVYDAEIDFDGYKDADIHNNTMNTAKTKRSKQKRHKKHSLLKVFFFTFDAKVHSRWLVGVDMRSVWKVFVCPRGIWSPFLCALCRILARTIWFTVKPLI